MKKKICTAFFILCFAVFQCRAYTVTAYEQNEGTNPTAEVQAEPKGADNDHLIYLFFFIGAVCFGASYVKNKRKPEEAEKAEDQPNQIHMEIMNKIENNR